MKNYIVWLQIVSGKETFIIYAKCLDDAIKDAKSQLPKGTIVMWSGGQVAS